MRQSIVSFCLKSTIHSNSYTHCRVQYLDSVEARSDVIAGLFTESHEGGHGGSHSLPPRDLADKEVC